MYVHVLQRGKQSLQIGTAEKKLLVALCYYMLVTALTQVTYVLTLKDFPTFVMNIFSYFICEKKGYDPDCPCSRSEFERFNYPTLTAFAYVTLALFPMCLLVFIVNIQELKNFFKSRAK